MHLTPPSPFMHNTPLPRAFITPSYLAVHGVKSNAKGKAAII